MNLSQDASALMLQTVYRPVSTYGGVHHYCEYAGLAVGQQYVPQGYGAASPETVSAVGQAVSGLFSTVATLIPQIKVGGKKKREAELQTMQMQVQMSQVEAQRAAQRNTTLLLGAGTLIAAGLVFWSIRGRRAEHLAGAF